MVAAWDYFNDGMVHHNTGMEIGSLLLIVVVVNFNYVICVSLLSDAVVSDGPLCTGAVDALRFNTSVMYDFIVIRRNFSDSCRSNPSLCISPDGDCVTIEMS